MISLKEIGRLCGVSESTVSKALKDHPAVSQKTRQHVQEVARKHHYVPNAHVQGIQSGRSQCIGVAVNDFGDPYSGRILCAAQEVLHEKGFDLIIIPWDLMVGKNEGLFDRFACRRTDGVLLFPTAEIPDTKTIAQLKSLDGPVVQIDQCWQNERFGYVGSANEDGGSQAIEALAKRGCRRIGMIGYGRISSGRERLQGALNALQKNGLFMDQSLFLDLGSDKEDDQKSRSLLSKYFKQKKQPDGIFCFNDRIAALAIKEAKAAGLTIPDDLQVIGFGNLPVGRLISPALTTFDQQPELIGRKAAELLLNHIDATARKADAGVRIVVPVKLVEQGSTCNPGRRI